MKKTPQQIKNLKDALVWWKTVPKKNVDLSSWRDNGTPPYTCNTICCFGGWCAVYPALVAQGVQVDPDCGDPFMWGEDGYRVYSSAVAQKLFGDWGMFCSRGMHQADPEKGSDHRAVTARIKAALANPEQT